jgi:hypothetical protein
MIFEIILSQRMRFGTFRANLNNSVSIGLKSVSIATNEKKGLIFNEFKGGPASNFNFFESTLNWQASPDLSWNSQRYIFHRIYL